MPQIKRLARKTHKTISVVLWNIFVLIIVFLLLEFFSGIFVSWYYESSNSINYEVFPSETFGREFINEANSVEAIYSPYIEYTAKPNIKGKFINTDEKGFRKTVNPCSVKSDELKIFVFGGSTVWGGIGDKNTLPSLISNKFCERGINVEISNFGESGYENTKEIIRLNLALREGNVPDLVIFYDGVNEVYSAFQNGYAGAPQNIANRVAEFNTKEELNLGGYIFYSDFMTIIRGISNRISPGSSNTETDVEALGGDVVSTYFENIKIVKGLGKEYDFESYFFWQPVIYFDKPLTDGEKSATLESVRSLYESSYSKIPEIDKNLNFYDISDVFSDLEEPVYMDFAHINVLGNKIVAEKIIEILLKEEKFK